MGRYNVFYLKKNFGPLIMGHLVYINYLSNIFFKMFYQIFYYFFRESKVLTRVLQSCILNGFIFLLSILVFEYVLLPAVKYLVTVVFGHDPGVAHSVWAWMQPFLSMTFRMIWVLPLFLLSKLVNALWFQVSNFINGVNLE